MLSQLNDQPFGIPLSLPHYASAGRTPHTAR
jgi:hypothetical protein